MPPPAPDAIFPEIVLLISVSVLVLKIPPPVLELLPKTVLLTRVSLPLPVLKMPPPNVDPVFPEMVLLTSVSVPSFQINPTPNLPKLLLVKLTSEIVTVTPGSTWTTWPLLPPLIARECAPGPRRVKLLVNDRLPLVNMIFPLTLAANLIVLPELVSAMTWRSDPCPSSLAEVTTFARMKVRTSTPAGIDNSRTSRTIAVTTTRDRMR